jgi:hypothetical protein
LPIIIRNNSAIKNTSINKNWQFGNYEGEIKMAKDPVSERKENSIGRADLRNG